MSGSVSVEEREAFLERLKPIVLGVGDVFGLDRVEGVGVPRGFASVGVGEMHYLAMEEDAGASAHRHRSEGAQLIARRCLVEDQEFLRVGILVPDVATMDSAHVRPGRNPEAAVFLRRVVESDPESNEFHGVGVQEIGILMGADCEIEFGVIDFSRMSILRQIGKVRLCYLFQYIYLF